MSHLGHRVNVLEDGPLILCISLNFLPIGDVSIVALMTVPLGFECESSEKFTKMERNVVILY